MQAPGGRIVVNPESKDWVYEGEKPDFSVTPMKRQIPYHVEEEIGTNRTKHDPWKQSESRRQVHFETAKPTQGSNRALLTVLSLVCLISIAALVLTVLTLFGKIGEVCGCSENEGWYIRLAEIYRSINKHIDHDLALLL